MENGRLADRQITASTYYDERYAPRRARLNGFSAWSSKTLDDFQFLEVGNSII